MSGIELIISRPKRALLGLAAGMAILVLGVGMVVPPALSNDFAAGWQVWTSMLAGAPFNSVWAPAATDLARDVPVFQAWWSPGQYLVPALFMQAGLDLAQAAVVTGVLASALGLAGWWRLWRVWGVTENLCVVAGAIVVLGRAWGAVAGTANPADALLFAAVPWAGLLAWRWRTLRPAEWLGLFVVFNAGVGLKLAFTVASLALLAGLGLQAWRENRGHPSRWLGIAARAALLWLAVKLLWDWGYLHRGASIGLGRELHWAGLAALSLPWGGPLLAVFSGGNLLGRIFLHPPDPLLADERALWPFYLVAAGLTLVVVRQVWAGHPSRAYATQVVAWIGLYGLVFTVVFASGANVSLEERHFHVAGLVLLPGLLWCVAQFRVRAVRLAVWLVMAGCCAYGSTALFVHARHRLRQGVTGRLGFTHTELTRGAQAELHRLDAEPGQRTLFYTSGVEIALEVQHGRALSIPVDYWPETLVRRFTFEGRAERLVLVLPARHVRNGRVEWIKAGLHAYHEWEAREVDGFCFITGR